MVLFGTETLLRPDCRDALPKPSRISESGPRHDQRRLAAVRRLAYEAADAGLLSPELAAGIRRVKGLKKHRDDEDLRL